MDDTAPDKESTLAIVRSWVGTCVFMLVQAVTVIPWAMLVLLCVVLPLPIRYRITVMWPEAMLHVLRVLCGVRWQVQGREHLQDRPVLLLSKHQSTWETFYFVWAMRRPMCFIFKRELLFVPFFGWGLGTLDMIHIDRSKGRVAFDDIVRQGSDRFARGRWIIMFPEGTRTPVGSQGVYKSGGARFAIHTKAPILPAAVNAGRLWNKHRFRIKAGLVTVSFGPLIEARPEESAEQLTGRVESWIEQEMRRISPGDYGTFRESGPLPARSSGDSVS